MIIDEKPRIQTPVSVIVHDIEFVNRHLSKAQYFFTDIKKEGILLYDGGHFQLKEARELLPAERKKLAQEDFNYYFEKAEKFIKLFNFALSEGAYNEAASDEIRDYVARSERHALRTAKLFLGTVIVCVLFVSGTLWWSHHVTSQLAEDRADLKVLDIKLKHKPVIVHFQGKDFVCVVPETETSFSRRDGSDVPGRYSQVWHVR